jgi:hypothetical protein
MKALKLNVVIGRDRRVVLDVPEDIEEGPAEVVLLVPEGPERQPRSNLEEHVARLIARSRSRTVEDIDTELKAERESWD